MHREPDRTAPEHDGRVARRDVRLRHGVDADGERLGERGVAVAEAVRHLDRERGRSAPSARRSRRGNGSSSRPRAARAASNATGIDTTTSPDLQVRAVRPELDDLARRTRGPSPRRAPGPCAPARSARAALARRSSSPSACIAAPCLSMWRSQPQMPQASVRTSTWPDRARGRGCSRTSSVQLRIVAARMDSDASGARRCRTCPS